MIIGFLFIAAFSLLIYIYRWNILHPNKSASVRIDNLERTFIYHVPQKLKQNPKLLIAYHGSKMKAVMMQIFTGHEFDLFADADENTIVVYPQGYKNNWNDSRKEAPFPAKKLNVDDIRFTEEIIYYFEEKYHIDTKHIFAAGFSNGGQMVMKLANHKPDLFKGFAVISANFPTPDNCDSKIIQSPVSILLMNGMKDPINPYNGGEVKLGGQSFGTVLSTENNINRYLKAADCDTSTFATKDFKDKAGRITAIQQDYYSGSTGKKISFVKIMDGGHTIPNLNFRIPIKVMGNMNKQVDGPKLIWDFFMSL